MSIPQLSESDLKIMANSIRALAMDAVEAAKSGHPGMPMGMADVATILFSEFLKFNPNNPKWQNRDRFILSAGHGSMLIYALLYLTGYKDISIEDIKNFRQLHAKTAGHPEYGHLAAIETTTGPLGQGLANSVGMAIAERITNSEFGDLINHFTYVIAGDGCLMEGISQEAISLAGHLQLNKLIVFFDDNHISIDGSTDLTISCNTKMRFEASNWNYIQINGHNFNEIRDAIKQAQNSTKPTVIACRTTIGYGAPTKAGKETSHGSPLGEAEIVGARNNLNWPYPAFVIPDESLNKWRGLANNSVKEIAEFETKFAALDLDRKNKLETYISGKLPENFNDIVSALKKSAIETKSEATRKSSGRVISEISKYMDNLVGGSADLTGSNDTKSKSHTPINSKDFTGRYIYYGVREHAMGAIMNGLALYGFIPYGGTFLVFSDYMRPAIRLSALMQQRVIYVMTHDSIGLGEDGPTHQPIEHLASLRAIPNLYVFRPADIIETIESWEIALQTKNAPSILSLTRQNVPLLREEATEENLSKLGAYILQEATLPLKATIMASGSEVEFAVNAAKILEQEEKIGVRVISMPCTKLFDMQAPEYKNKLLGNSSLKIMVEAGSSFGAEKYIKDEGIFIGIDSFGASAKAEDLYQYFGITVENICKKIKDRLCKK